MSESTLRQPPRGWKAFFWRAPIFFYKVGLGGLLRKHFVLLNHIGRKSGLPRQAVLEVVDYDAQIYYIASGFGKKSHWYQNIIHTPQVNIQVGRKKMAAIAEELNKEDALKILTRYAEAHPFALKELSYILGLSYTGKTEEIEQMVSLLPILALHIQNKE